MSIYVEVYTYLGVKIPIGIVPPKSPSGYHGQGLLGRKPEKIELVIRGIHGFYSMFMCMSSTAMIEFPCYSVSSERQILKTPVLDNVINLHTRSDAD